MRKSVTDKLLNKHPELVTHLMNYIYRKSILGKPIRKLNGSRCWTFTGHVIPAGYGIISTTNKNIMNDVSFRGYAHRVSYMVFNGNTHGLRVLHHCDNPACVCPEHLYIGTPQDNSNNASDRFAFAHPTTKSWKTTGLRKRMFKALFDQFTIGEIAEEFGVPYQRVFYYFNK